MSENLKTYFYLGIPLYTSVAGTFIKNWETRWSTSELRKRYGKYLNGRYVVI